MMLKINMPGFDEEEVSVIVEAAYYAMKNHYEGLADHLDLADEFLQPIVDKFLDCLDE